MMSCRKLLIACTCGLVCYASLVLADEGDVLNFSASVNATRDSNLFRLAPSASPASLGLDGRSDTYTATTLGMNFTKQFSLQQVIANISVVDTRYQRNSYLDFQALNYDANWLWALGTRWTGELAVDRTESLNAFTDYTNYRIKNVRTIENQRFTANYWFHTNWAALVGVSRINLTNEQPFLADSDYQANGYNYGIRYRPVSGSLLTLRAKYLDGTYSKRQFDVVSQYDNGFSQESYELNVDWGMTGKSQLHGRMEYLDRKHEHFSSRNYSGWAGNLDFSYFATAKSILILGYKHGLESYQQTTSSYFTLDEVNVSSRWLPTNVITASARVGYGKRVYAGEIVPLPAGMVQREDKYTRAGIDLSYLPLRWVEIKGGFALEKRNVNEGNFDYNDRISFISVTAKY